MKEFEYPAAKMVDQVDDYHGTLIDDPYRWLEDTESPDTHAWIETQNKLTFSFLENIPARGSIRARLEELWDYPKAWAPLKKGDRFFQLRNSGLQNQDVLFVMDTLDEADPRVLLDPNTLSEDGTVALSTWTVSKNGRWLAYATSTSGSDWLTWRVRDVDNGKDLPDLIEWSKFSEAAWLPDSSGFFYARYDVPEEGQEFQGTNYFQKLYFHQLGDIQDQDELIYHRPDEKEWGFGSVISEDDNYLIIIVWQGTDRRNRLFYKDLRTDEPVIELISELEAGYKFVGNDGPVFYIWTDLDAPRGRLISINTSETGKKSKRTLIPQDEDTLEHVKMVNDQFVALYMQDAYHLIRRFSIDGDYLGEIPLPTLGTVFADIPNWSFNGERTDKELFFAFLSFVVPTTIYRYDFENDRCEVLFVPPINFDFEPYDTRQVFVTSKDGTRVPMFLIHQRSLLANKPLPTLLYGYGGFNISMTPIFSISRLVFIEMGGVLALPNLRGGGEYGEEWHRAGTLENKQNVFDDFIACAEYLIDDGITSSEKLAIQGGSNGGLLVGACMTQRPDLFGASLPAVGVMDMLRFHKFTIGWAWVSDFGCSDDPDQFKYLYAYSPLHNLKSGSHYPATLITTADHDDRVVPGHSFKFAATLQVAQAGKSPTLIRIQTKAGHGFGKPTRLIIDEQADIWAFATHTLGMDVEFKS